MAHRVTAYLVLVAGDRDRWVQYVRDHGPRDLFGFVEPADILGAAMVSALRYSGVIHGESERELDAWFRSIIYNLIQNLLREKKRREGAARRWAEAQCDGMRGHPEIDDLAYKELLQRLDSALSDLSAESLEIFVDRVFLKKSFDELARSREITKTAARSRSTVSGSTSNSAS